MKSVNDLGDADEVSSFLFLKSNLPAVTRSKNSEKITLKIVSG